MDKFFNVLPLKWWENSPLQDGKKQPATTKSTIQ